MESDVKRKVRQFIVANFLFGDESREFGDGDSLINKGIIDSTGILELIEFLEGDFTIKVLESETVPENLDSIAGITAFVGKKKGAA